MRSPLLVAASIVLATQSLEAQRFVPGKTYWGTNRYVEYIAGNAPIVLSSGHGGYLEPPNIPDRTYGVTGQDRRTQELGRAVFDAVVRKTGRYPHFIVSHLHRVKLDPNREIVEAAQGNPIAEQAWREFHNLVAAATSTVQTQWGQGHYFDLHGHAHPEDWIELGYALSSSQLGLSNAQINSSTYINQSTLRWIGQAPGVYFPAVLRGANSFGGLLEGAGYLTVPGPTNPSPAGGNYFTGGYNVRTHSSKVHGSCDATQIELPWTIRGTRVDRDRFAERLADSISTVLQTFYGINPAADPRITVTATDASAHETGDPGSFTFTRTGNLSHPITVGFEVSGRASPGSDYAAIGTSVQFPANQASVTLTITPLDDLIEEGSETVTVHLVGDVEIGAPARATVLIADDERDPTLLARWAMDLPSGPQILDDSGSGNHGWLQPSQQSGPRRVPGKFGGGLSFDEVDDYVRVPQFSYAPNGDFSLSMWFKAPPSSQAVYQYMLGSGTFGNPGTVHVYLGEFDGRLLTNIEYDNRLVNTTLLQSYGDVMDGQWHHCAISATTDGLSRIWVDGVEREVVQLGGNSFTNSDDLLLGIRNGFSSTRYFGGSMDDVRVYGRALEPAEILALSRLVPGRFTPSGTGCNGTLGTPRLAATGIPQIGNAVSYVVELGPSSRAAALALGTSTTTWQGQPLPFDLTPLGATGCQVLVAPQLWLQTTTNQLGSTTLGLTIPSSSSLIGLRFSGQSWFLDPGANPLSVTVSNRVDASIGG